MSRKDQYSYPNKAPRGYPTSHNQNYKVKPSNYAKGALIRVPNGNPV